MAGYFARKATGLVRQANTKDVFVYNVNFANLGNAVFLFLFLSTIAYPGLNIYLSIIFCAILILPVALAYAMFASAMPRSGGDYVYVSRALSPLWGFVANWNFTIWCFFYIGIPASFVSRWGLAPIFRTLGVYLHKPSLYTESQWLGSSLGISILGTLLIVVSALILVGGIRVYMRFLRLFFLVAMAGLCASLILFLINTPASASAALNHYVHALTGHGHTYGDILASAKGRRLNVPFSFKNTLISVTWPFVTLGFGIGSAYIGGEIKNAPRAQMIGMPGSVVYCTVWLLALTWALFHAFGYGFMQHLSGVNPSTLLSSSGKLGFIPLYSELSALLTSHIYVALLAELGLLAWVLVLLPLYFVIATRNMLAWALDGILPARIADVDERSHSPVLAIAVALALGIVALWSYAYFIPYSTISGLFGQLVGTYFVTCIAAALFPWRQRDMFESSPVSWRLWGIPVLSVVGVLGAVGAATIGWAFLNDPFSGVSIEHPLLLIINAIVFASGFVVFWLAKWIRARQGIDISLAFAEIPPE
jgi:amino acid transporter